MEVIRFLHKEHPGAINAATRRRKLPLHVAVAAKYAPSAELTRFLIAESPQAVKARDAKGRLPVHVAFEKEKGFSVACEKEKGFSASIALHVVKQWPEAVREPHSDGRFPLHKALSQEDQSFELIQLVLQWCPEALESQHPDGDLPLHAVLNLKDPSQRIVKHVVEKNSASSLLKQDANGRTPLHLAIRKTSLPFELVQLIMKRGPGALLKADKRGLLPLHVALASRRTSTLKCTECLVKECAESLQVQDRAGRTPLAVASASDAPLGVVHFLLVAWPQALLHFRAGPFAPDQVRHRSVRALR
jgi:Ankyrin repeats (3 copies)